MLYDKCVNISQNYTYLCYQCVIYAHSDWCVKILCDTRWNKVHKAKVQSFP